MLSQLLKKVCNNLGMECKQMDANGIFLQIKLKNGSFHYCIANNLGLNNEVVEKICVDKIFLYMLLKSTVRMPKTYSYLDPGSPEIFSQFKSFGSTDDLVQDIQKKIPLPVILKPNSKSMGIHVFKCETAEETSKAIETIFNKKSYLYDHVLLVQEKIEIYKEFRVVVYNGEIQFIYQKDNTFENSKFTGNLSPLHFSNSKAVLIKQTEWEDRIKSKIPANQGTDVENLIGQNSVLVQQIQEFIQPVFSVLNLKYAGVDIAQDKLGNLYLLEINSKPGFTFFIRDNGEKEVVRLLNKVLSDLS